MAHARSSCRAAHPPRRSIFAAQVARSQAGAILWVPFGSVGASTGPSATTSPRSSSSVCAGSCAQRWATERDADRMRYDSYLSGSTTDASHSRKRSPQRPVAIRPDYSPKVASHRCTTKRSPSRVTWPEASPETPASELNVTASAKRPHAHGAPSALSCIASRGVSWYSRSSLAKHRLRF